MSRASDIMNEVNKALGKKTVKLASDPSLQVKFLRTGVLPLDVLLHGGLPRGRSVEIYGAPSTLKSYIALCAIAECQADGGVAGLVDTEHAFDPVWAVSIGVDLDELILEQPEYGEEAADTCQMLLNREVDLIVWDSVAATLPMSEAVDDKGNVKSHTGKVQPARQAAFMSRALRKLNAANKTTAMLWINQTREKIGVTFGNPESVPGGRALPFYSSYRIAMNLSTKDKEKVSVHVDGANKSVDEVVAQTIRASLLKSKLNKPFRDTYFKFDLRSGSVDDLGFLINQGVDLGIVKTKKKGNATTFTYGQCTATGSKRFRTAMEKSPAHVRKLYDAVTGAVIVGDVE